MEERYNLRCAVFLILTEKRKDDTYILLQRRYNTGLHDGLWDVAASGHVEKDETLSYAIIREAR